MSNYEYGFAVLDSKIDYKAIGSYLNHMTESRIDIQIHDTDYFKSMRKKMK